MRGICIGVVIALAAACQNEKGGQGPTADCQVVGKYAASFELGNYAPVEERAPTEARFIAACRHVGVSPKQGECLMAAKDVWSAAVCAPKLFPKVKVDGDCGAIAARVRESLNRTMGKGGDPERTKMIDKLILVIRDSCEQDGWPAQFKGCILDAKDVVKDMDKCDELMTPELKSKLETRMRGAL